MAQGSSYRGTAFGMTAGVTAILFGAFILPLFFPQLRAWGINHLLFLPTMYTWLFIFFSGITCAALFWPGVFKTSFGAVSRLFPDETHRTRWLLISLISMILFWLLRLPVYLLGDSASVIANISNELPVIYKWSESGAIVTADLISRMASLFSGSPGLLAYNVIAVISGGVTVFLFIGIAYELGKTPVERLFVFSLSFCAGWTVLFLGYTENYPVLWPFVTGYIYFALRYLTSRGSLIVPLVFLLASMILHLQTVFFLLTVPMLLIHHGRAAKLYASKRSLVHVVGGVILLSALVLGAYLYQTVEEIRLYLMPLTTQPGVSGSYTLFSTAHIIDIGNQLLLLMPIFPVLLVAGWQGWKQFKADSVNQFLLLLSLGGMAFLFVIDPKFGMGRDWDLFALAGLGPLLLLARGVLSHRNKWKPLYPAFVLALLTMTLPYFAVNLNYSSAVNKFSYLLDLDKTRSRSGLTVLREHYLQRGNSRAADSLKQVIVDYYPSTRLVPQTYNLVKAGDFATARIYIDSIMAIDPHSVELYNVRGTYYLQQGIYDSAIKDLQMAAQIARYDSKSLINLAQAYSMTGQYSKMSKVLISAQQRNPESAEVAEGLATWYLMRDMYDSSFVYSSKLITKRPDNPVGYLIAGYSMYHRSRLGSARPYFTKFLELSPSHSQAEEVRSLLGK